MAVLLSYSLQNIFPLPRIDLLFNPWWEAVLYKKLVGRDLDSIRLPLTKTQFETPSTSTDWQIALADFPGQVEHSLPQIRHYIFVPHQVPLPH